MQVFLDHEKLYNYFGIGGEVLAPNYVIGSLWITLLPKKGLSYKILDLLKAFFLDRNQTGVCLAGLGANNCALIQRIWRSGIHDFHEQSCRTQQRVVSENATK